jgi:hypothetical protein
MGPEPALGNCQAQSKIWYTKMQTKTKAKRKMHTKTNTNRKKVWNFFGDSSEIDSQSHCT